MLTVKKLIEALSNMPQDAVVVLRTWEDGNFAEEVGMDTSTFYWKGDDPVITTIGVTHKNTVVITD